MEPPIWARTCTKNFFPLTFLPLLRAEISCDVEEQKHLVLRVVIVIVHLNFLPCHHVVRLELREEMVALLKVRSRWSWHETKVNELAVDTSNYDAL